MRTTRHGARCGRFLLDARRRNGLSQADLAARAGTTQANVSRIERDKISPSVFTLNRLLEAMGETLQIVAVPVGAPPPGGGNVSIRELRDDFDRLTAGERLEQAAILSGVASELADSRFEG